MIKKHGTWDVAIKLVMGQARHGPLKVSESFGIHWVKAHPTRAVKENHPKATELFPGFDQLLHGNPIEHMQFPPSYWGSPNS